ncbi:MAG TPA: DUF5686 and carboxypeptidase regulatory-like domain-containing protein [Flavisolibacter sp.]|jgi:hypothetical protein|nr:DUF5686 and carboxypeptidase regulatory-like domain-containing protein [Flavisolibacter sp.]
MYKSFWLTILFFLSAQILYAQTYKVTGKVTNNKLEPLAFVSLQFKQSQAGTITKEDGSFQLTVEEGTYDLLVSMIGYKPQTLKFTVTKDYQQNIILEEDDTKALDDIVIKVKIKDRSEEIIKNVIRHKEELTNASGPFSVNLYIKAIQQDSSLTKKDRARTDSSLFVPNADLNGMAMAEISSHLDYESEQHMKEERLGVKKNGSADNLFYLTATDGDFSFYNNLVKVPAISPTAFLSPISYSGLLAYKFKTLKIEKRDGKRVYIISVKPRQISNATVEGEVTIQDSTWAILHTRLRFPSYHLPEYDFFEVDQQYSFIQDKAWMLTRQQFNYYSKSSRRKLSGQTLVTYSDYHLNKEFGKKYFGVEVSATAQEAYEKDSTFWETVRTEPLSDKELRFIRLKDSIYRVTHTENYLDSLERENNRVTWKKLGIFGQTFYDRKKERTFMLPPLISLYEPLQFGGGRLHAYFFLFKRYQSRKDISIFTELSYGFRNKDINGGLRLNRMYNPFNRGYYVFEIQRSFDRIYRGDAWINQIKRSSYFLNNYFGVGHGLELLNGLSLHTEVDLSLRRSVNGYKTNDKIDSLLGGILDDNQPVAFEPFNGFYTQATLKYTPRQRYIREPKEKIILGSKWPTFYVYYRKGVPGLLNSKVDFDYLEFGAEQKINVGLLGETRYRFRSGKYMNQKELKLMDYSYQRRGDPFLFMNPDEAFQALDSTFPLFNRFYQTHLVHEFNGFLINKIPLLKKLQLREIAGGGFLIAPERNLRYGELFGGIERVFKWPFNPLTKFKLGVYVVGSMSNQYTNPIQFKVGLTTWDKKRNKWN